MIVRLNEADEGLAMFCILSSLLYSENTVFSVRES